MSTQLPLFVFSLLVLVVVLPFVAQANFSGPVIVGALLCGFFGPMVILTYRRNDG